MSKNPLKNTKNFQIHKVGKGWVVTRYGVPDSVLYATKRVALEQLARTGELADWEREQGYVSFGPTTKRKSILLAERPIDTARRHAKNPTRRHMEDLEPIQRMSDAWLQKHLKTATGTRRDFILQEMGRRVALEFASSRAGRPSKNPSPVTEKLPKKLTKFQIDQEVGEMHDECVFYGYSPEETKRVCVAYRKHLKAQK